MLQLNQCLIYDTANQVMVHQYRIVQNFDGGNIDGFDT